MNISIEEKDLKQREYEDKECVAFVYDIVFGENEESRILRCFYHRVKEKIWQLEVWDYCTANKSDVIYRWVYDMPKNNMSLKMICAFGLTRLQLQMKEEVQMKSEIDFTLSELLKDIYG